MMAKSVSIISDTKIEREELINLLRKINIIVPSVSVDVKSEGLEFGSLQRGESCVWLYLYDLGGFSSPAEQTKKGTRSQPQTHLIVELNTEEESERLAAEFIYLFGARWPFKVDHCDNNFSSIQEVQKLFSKDQPKLLVASN
jgi:hypothetical protein